MKIIFLLTSLLFISLTATTVSAQTSDTTKQTTLTKTDAAATATTAHPSTDDDFSPGMAFIAIMAVCFVFICVGAGAVLAAVILLIIFGLIMAGVISTSLLVGLNKRSFAKGFKTFLVMTFGIGGFANCAILVFLLNRFLHLHLTTATALLLGAFCGLIAGMILGLVVFVVLQRILIYLGKRLNLEE